ncbi:MAG: DnaJ C-terminal domain-containing protein, partial [Clostridia bacterium]
GTRVTVGTCDKCGGSGQIVTDKCKTCNGKGVVSKNKVVTVEIPAGVEDQTARVKRGEGNACRQAGGMSGNLILSFMVEDSKVFKRNDLNLYAEIPVPYETSVSGGDIEIPTLNGMITQHISEGTANGTVFRVRGKGIHSEQGVGDLYITAKVEVPVGLSRTQKKSLADFEKELTLKNYPKRQEFLKNIEEMYKETAE